MYEHTGVVQTHIDGAAMNHRKARDTHSCILRLQPFRLPLSLVPVHPSDHQAAVGFLNPRPPSSPPSGFRGSVVRLPSCVAVYRHIMLLRARAPSNSLPRLFCRFSSSQAAPKVITEVKGNVLWIGLNRPEKKNAMDADMLLALNDAYTRIAQDPAVRVGLVYTTSDTFTSGLDLPAIAPVFASPRRALKLLPWGRGRVDPFGAFGRPCPKPVVLAVSGACFTSGLEMALAADIVIADRTARFAQMETSRGIIPFGGALQRMPAVFGYQNAMRYLVTGDQFDAQRAHELGLVQEVVPERQAVEAAAAVCDKIARQAPLAVQALLKQVRAARPEPGLRPWRLLNLMADVVRLMGSKDTKEAVKAMKEKRPPQFQGK